MNRTTLMTIIEDFQILIEGLNIIDRSQTVPQLPQRKACTVIGPRRCGKTFFLYSIAKKHISENEKEGVLYINFEDDRLFPLSLKDLDNILKTYFELYPEQKNKKSLILFDEIQCVEGWERYVRRILDTENVLLYLSGSSSKLLSHEISTSLRGRTLTIELFPFNPREFLKQKLFPLKKIPNYSSKQLAFLKNSLAEFLKFGGFPEIVASETSVKYKILKDYIEIMVYRDIIERYEIRNIKVVKLFLKMLVTSISKEFSVNTSYNFMRSMQLKTSKNSLYEYLELFHDAFVIFPLRKFSRSIKQQEQTIPKIYLVDSGYLIPMVFGNTEFSGRLLENAVFLTFRQGGYEENETIFYYITKKGYEVDFVTFKNNKPEQLIQCCYDISDVQTKKREIRALREASAELECNQLCIITWDFEFNQDGILFVPFWKFCLEYPD